MTLDEKCKIYHDKGYNCCQSVLCALGEYTKLPEETAIKLGAGFGGGMQCGSVCGAVTGGLMSLGAAMPKREPNDNRPLAKTAALELEERFQQKFGTLLCSEIVRDNGKRICGDCVAFCVENTADMIEKMNKGEL